MPQRTIYLVQYTVGGIPDEPQAFAREAIADAFFHYCRKADNLRFDANGTEHDPEDWPTGEFYASDAEGETELRAYAVPVLLTEVQAK